MDDSYEEPAAIPIKKLPIEQVDEEDQQSSDEEDGGLDWTKL